MKKETIKEFGICVHGSQLHITILSWRWFIMHYTTPAATQTAGLGQRQRAAHTQKLIAIRDGDSSRTNNASLKLIKGMW